MKGTELPDYYYVVPGTEKEADTDEKGEIVKKEWEGDYIYYDGLTYEKGQFYHAICYCTQDEKITYLLDDSTCEMTDERYDRGILYHFWNLEE